MPEVEPSTMQFALDASGDRDSDQPAPREPLAEVRSRGALFCAGRRTYRYGRCLVRVPGHRNRCRYIGIPVTQT